MADIFDDLDKISNGELDRHKFTKDFYESLLSPVENMVKKAKRRDGDLEKYYDIYENLLISILTFSFIVAQTPERVNKQIDKLADKIEKKVIKWRRDIHQNPVRIRYP